MTFLLFQCTVGSNPVACNFTGTVGNAVVSAYSPSSTAPYVFTDGLLSMLFDNIVSLWFQQQTAKTMSGQAQSRQSSGFFSVAVVVPSGFVSSLPGGVTGQTLFASSLSGAFSSLPASNVFDMAVCGLVAFSHAPFLDV